MSPGLDDVRHFLRPAGILAHERPVERRNLGVRVVARREQRRGEARSRSGARAYCASSRRAHARPTSLGAGAYSPKTVTVLPFACAASQRNPPDE